MPLKIVFAVLTVFIVFTSSVKIQNLGGTWSLSEAKGEYENLKAEVPGGIYSDLMNNGIIDDIFYGYNDNLTKWVPRSNWTYFTNFTVDDDLLAFENINIVFDGLDTFASVYINDAKVGESQNMFVQYIFNIKSQLKSGVNGIEVRFQSPIEAAEYYAGEQNKSYNVPPNCPPNEYNGDCHVNMIRKMQASFSWDWGPSFPSVGIWKDLYIEAYNESAIRYVVVDTEEKADGTAWVLHIDTYFASNNRQYVVGTLAFQLALSSNLNLTRIFQISQPPNEYDEILMTTSIEVPISLVNTWWPNGYGAHNLYNLSVIFSDANETEISTKNLRIGFRMIEVVQDTLDSGLTFYFKVNGVPIFMKGSNEIPINILPEKGQNQTIIKELLTAAQDSHMNMLRVWGGGVYESDYFYGLADELGILIWQDFTFACALYPTNEAYINNVLEEIRHQIKRLRSHASLALFSGNNENEGALADNWYGTQDNFETFKKDYVKLYIDTIGKEYERLTHNRGIFLASSPTNGKESENEGYVSSYPGNPLYGDVHYYNYVLDSFKSIIYPIPRFASEYGYQSLPSVKTLLTATNNISDLNIYGDFIYHRQHHPQGTAEMHLLIDYQLQLPDEDSINYNEVFIYYSQIVHALSTKIETEHYRRYRSSLDGEGRGYTMGALYWQLNDVWVAPTWASIDFTGKWKMLQYYTADFFAPIIITGHINAANTLEIYVVSDLLSPVFNVTAFIQVFNYNSIEPVSVSNLTLDLESGKSHLIESFNIDDYLIEKECGDYINARYNCSIYLTLEKEGMKIAPDNYVLPAKLRYSNLLKANVEIESIKKISDEEVYEIKITTDEIALFVWLDSSEVKGKFSENGYLQFNKTRTLYFYSEQSTSTDELLQDITITHLLDKQ